jgi:hypothetical protein
LTLREFWNWHLAQQADELERFNQAAIVAWQIERVRLLTMKPDGHFKLPTLDSLFVTARAARRQTLAQQRMVVQQISAHLGIPLQRRIHGDPIRQGRGASRNERRAPETAGRRAR